MPQVCPWVASLRSRTGQAPICWLAKAAVSLSDYLLREISKIAERPTLEKMLERLPKLPPIEPSIDPVDIMRAYRDRE